MAFIEKKVHINRVQLTTKIDEPVYDELELYVKFADADRSYVVNNVLKAAFDSDEEFQAFKNRKKAATPPAMRVAS